MTYMLSLCPACAGQRLISLKGVTVAKITITKQYNTPEMQAHGVKEIMEKDLAHFLARGWKKAIQPRMLKKEEPKEAAPVEEKPKKRGRPKKDKNVS